MAYIARDEQDRLNRNLRSVEPPRAMAREPHDGLAEALFTGLNAAVFMVLMAAVAAAAILYSQGA